jgi:DNA repair protein RecN (Recombination protein N)
VLYGQAEARDLLDPAAPRERLDRFAGISEAAERTASLFSELKRLQGERDRIAGAAADRGKRLELLDFQIAEIDVVRPVPGEDERLSSEKVKLANVERVGKLLGDALAALESEEGGAINAASAARRAFQTLCEIDPSFSSKVSEAADAIERLREIAFSASRELSGLEADPGRLSFVAERLDALAKLKRKYGATLEEVLAHREAIGGERDELTDLEGSLKKAEEAARLAFEEYRKAALELSAARAAAAPRFSRAVENHLKDLAFVRASFKVEVSRRPDDESPFVAGGERVAYGSPGIDQVALSFAPNPGEPPRPLPKIASGGELARVQLALAAALAEEDVRAEARSKDVRKPARGGRRCGPVRTFVFDEVDAGVSGATAEAVGKKLRGLAAREQILVVTHLPQVAAAGERHLLVSKETAGGRTKTRVTPLDGKGRVEAIAAMLAGSSVGEAARAHARQLLSGFPKG